MSISSFDILAGDIVNYKKVFFVVKIKLNCQMQYGGMLAINDMFLIWQHFCTVLRVLKKDGTTNFRKKMEYQPSNI